jgi:hypothetical protein
LKIESVTFSLNPFHKYYNKKLKRYKIEYFFFTQSILRMSLTNDYIIHLYQEHNYILYHFTLNFKDIDYYNEEHIISCFKNYIIKYFNLTSDIARQKIQIVKTKINVINYVFNINDNILELSIDTQNKDNNIEIIIKYFVTNKQSFESKMFHTIGFYVQQNLIQYVKQLNESIREKRIKSRL